MTKPGCLTTKQRKSMKKVVLIIALAISGSSLFAQEQSSERQRSSNEIETLFRGPQTFGGYGSLTNKFTRINGSFANLSGGYGGVFVNHKVMIGIGAVATTNFIPVAEEFSISPGDRMTYEYGQFGLVTEYALWSNKAIHLNFNLFTGAGFTLQYERPQNWYDDDYYDPRPYGHNDENWFFVVEPGVQLEMNVFKWMRIAPGVSYRQAYGSDAAGLPDASLSDITYSFTLKFGKF
jgi:hypothetical protein